MRRSKRIEKVPPYLFVGISRKKAEKKAKGIEVIDFGIGDPDIPTPAPIIETLREAATDTPNHRYPETEGLPSFRAASADWYERRFGISLDPEKEVLSADWSQGRDRPFGPLFRRSGRYGARTGPGIPGLLGRDLVRGRRVPLDASA